MPWLNFSNSLDLTLFQDLVAFYNFNGNLVDTSGQGNNATIQGGVTSTNGRDGSASNGLLFNGTTGFLSTTNTLNSPQDYSSNVWFKTSSTGGVLIAFTNSQTSSTPSNFDRILWIDTTGHANFGVYIGSVHYITSVGTFNNGNWHMATATMSSTLGMGLYIDGVSVATDANTVSQTYAGWWRIGESNNTGGWPGTMNKFFTGTIDDVKIYSTALNSVQVAELYGL
jgi:hypothetical protein